MKYIINRQIKRGKQYEVWISIFDDHDKLILGNHIVSLGKVELDKKSLDIFIRDKAYPSLDRKDTGQMVLVSEVGRILREKGYLAIDESFDDLEGKHG